MMLSQYTADLDRGAADPVGARHIQSIPAAADQEDFVSMGMNTAIKNGQILDNAYGVLGIEFMAAAQALDFREFTPGVGTRAAHAVIRRHVAPLDEDQAALPRPRCDEGPRPIRGAARGGGGRCRITGTTRRLTPRTCEAVTDRTTSSAQHAAR